LIKFGKKIHRRFSRLFSSNHVEPPSADLNLSARMDFAGHVDEFSEIQVRGWAVDNSDSSKRQSVEIWVNDKQIATVMADIYRKDLEELHISDGHSGFSHRFALNDFKSAKQYEVRVVFAGTSIPVPEGTKVFLPDDLPKLKSFECFAESPLNLYEVRNFKAANFASSGPEPWLDRKDAKFDVNRRLEEGEISDHEAKLCLSWIEKGYIIVNDIYEPELLDQVWASDEDA
jgi:hypothetical protein